MNLAGSSVGPLARYYRVPIQSIIVVFDDLDLPLGTLRLRGGGGSGGHRGMQSIIGALGEDTFPRLRLGIGRPPGRMDPADFVLEDFDEDEAPAAQEAIGRAVDCLADLVRSGLERAMTRFNTAPD
jgi:PTH1 family peptidyl-tRNA hydrolase